MVLRQPDIKVILGGKCVCPSREENVAAEKGIVYDIQRYTVHDGPGIRTEIFLKGCPLKCKWCSNPESANPKQELGLYPAKCIGVDKCGLCLKACPIPENSPLIVRDNIISSINRDICTQCLACAVNCYPNAIKVWGNLMTVDEVMKVVRSDIDYYEKSGGGITLNGGEVLVQWEFAREILKRCRECEIHTCVETTMHGSFRILEELFPYTDLMITDIKTMDDSVHKEYTGASNELILENMKKAARAGVKLVIRIPVIPGINNSEENIIATSKFISEDLGNKVAQVQLLPYRKMGIEKYNSLERPYPMGDNFTMPEREVWEKNILHLKDIMTEYDVPAVAGSSTEIQ
jgi:pyruvate formate lyase activating enzyme